MKEIFVRICGWYTFVLFLILSLVLLVVVFVDGLDIDIAIIICFMMFISLSLTGWNAKKYGLKNYSLNRFMKLIAVLPLILLIVFIFFIPIWVMNSAGLDIPDKAIWLLILMFLPGMISSIAILITRGKKNNA